MKNKEKAIIFWLIAKISLEKFYIYSTTNTCSKTRKNFTLCISIHIAYLACKYHMFIQFYIFNKVYMFGKTFIFKNPNDIAYFSFTKKENNIVKYIKLIKNFNASNN